MIFGIAREALVHERLRLASRDSGPALAGDPDSDNSKVVRTRLQYLIITYRNSVSSL